MTSDLHRKLISEGVIGLSVVLGLHFVIADPMRTKLSDLRKRSSEVAASIPKPTEEAGALPQAMALVASCEAQRTRIAEQGSLARDERAMFTRLMQLASECGVRLDRLDPRPVTIPSAPAPVVAPDSAFAPGAPATAGAPSMAPSPEGPAALRSTDAGLGYTITLTADYAPLSRFLAALQTQLGYTQIRSLRIQPIANSADTGAGALGVTVETSHFAIDASPIAIPAPPPSGALSGVTPQ